MTIHSREYLDQSVAFVCAAFYLPDGVRPGAKEHPARQGAVDSCRTRDSISRRHDLVLLDPSLNDFQGMQEAAPRLQGWATDLIGSEPTPWTIVTVMTEETLAWSVLPRGEVAGYFSRYGRLGPRIASENIGETFSIIENADNQAIAFESHCRAGWHGPAP